MSPEREAAQEIEAALLVYARDIDNLADRYPELKRWVERIRAGGADVFGHVERGDSSEEGPPMTTDLVATKPKCGQKECVLDATAKMHWPGREPMLVCAEHDAQARAIAGAMGLTLFIERP